MSLISLKKNRNSIPILCKLLAAGEVIAAPTETAYGLLADATNPQAVKKILKIKGERLLKPIAIIVSSLTTAEKWASFSETEKNLATKFWPGALTIVLKAKGKLVSGVVAQDKTIGLRVPGNTWLRNLLAAYKKPLTATSANITGTATLYTAAAVIKNLQPRGLKYLVNGGQLKISATSTVVRIEKGKINILRIGAISEHRLTLVVK